MNLGSPRIEFAPRRAGPSRAARRASRLILCHVGAIRRQAAESARRLSSRQQRAARLAFAAKASVWPEIFAVGEQRGGQMGHRLEVAHVARMQIAGTDTWRLIAVQQVRALDVRVWDKNELSFSRSLLRWRKMAPARIRDEMNLPSRSSSSSAVRHWPRF